MYRHDLEKKKLGFKITAKQMEILVGTLLGDGHLETQNHGKTYRVKIEHSFAQKEYVDWLYTHFKTWVETAPRMRMRKVKFERQRETEYAQYGFQTLCSGSFRFFAHQFYNSGVKVVPKQIRRWLSPLALAVWFMDDGSIKSKTHRTILLNTQGFSIKDMERLQKALQEQWGIHTTLRKQGAGSQIYVGSESIGVFIALIQPHILPSLQYKIPTYWLTHLPKK